MMYESKLVASLKANGRILREFKDTVYIPFGSEYSFLIKNLNTKRALVNVFIDGDNVVPGGLVVNAGQEIDLERSIINGNLREGNRFKFIERSGAVEKHRGVKLEDGLVRIEFQFEQHPMQSFFDTHIYNKGITRGWAHPASAASDGFTLTASGASYSTNSMNVSAQAALNDVGITVPGSKSSQSFSTTTMGIMETVTHTIVLKLLGETADNKPVLQPVNVKMKPKCVTCGKQNKATAKFCTECGTALEIFA